MKKLSMKKKVQLIILACVSLMLIILFSVIFHQNSLAHKKYSQTISVNEVVGQLINVEKEIENIREKESQVNTGLSEPKNIDEKTTETVKKEEEEEEKEEGEGEKEKSTNEETSFISSLPIINSPYGSTEEAADNLNRQIDERITYENGEHLKEDNLIKYIELYQAELDKYVEDGFISDGIIYCDDSPSRVYYVYIAIGGMGSVYTTYQV